MKVATTWEEFVWPEWVPLDVRASIESFWSSESGRSPREWLENAIHNGAPEMGSVVEGPNGFGPNAPTTTGRFVFCWNNICRLVHDDGTFSYSSFDRLTQSREGAGTV